MKLFINTDMNRSADLSDCGKYRYELTRCWRPDANQLGWIMLNPSTADALDDDPTIRRCMGFARAWDFGGIVVTNLFNLRATDPAELSKLDVDAIGPKSPEETLAAVFDRCTMIIAAWGSHGIVESAREYVRVRRIALDRNLPVHCLAINTDGQPRHPLYVKANTKPIVWFDPKSVGGAA